MPAATQMNTDTVLSLNANNNDEHGSEHVIASVARQSSAGFITLTIASRRTAAIISHL